MSDKEAVEQIVYILAGLILLGAIATAITNFIDSLQVGQYGGVVDTFVRYFLEHIWPTWKVVAVFVSAAAAVGITYNIVQINAIAAEEAKIYGPKEESAGVVAKDDKDDRWEKIVKLSNSDSESDWRRAILEADNMLEDCLQAIGYVGDGIGEMLKTVDKTDFLTLDAAWEAHKARNDVAHGGSNFQLNQHETKRIIALFEQVFDEFEVI